MSHAMSHGSGRLTSFSTGLLPPRHRLCPTQIRGERRRVNGVRIRATLDTKTSQPATERVLTADSGPQAVLAVPAVEPPGSSVPVTKFMTDAPNYCKESFEKHGKVFTISIGGGKLYALVGAGPLRKFYDPALIRRFPAASPTNLNYVWQWKGGYALPPLDGVAHQKRKSHLMNTIVSKQSAEKYLQALDPLLLRAFTGAGRDGPFSLLQLVAKTYMIALSKDFFGYSIEDYGKPDAMVTAVFDNFDIFNQPATVKDSAKEGYKAICTYFEAALAKYRADPEKYKGTGLACYFADPAAAEFCDGDVIMDMHQLFVEGSCAVVPAAASMAYMLCQRPDILDKLREEAQYVKRVSFDSLRTLPYTFAFVKENLRYFCQVNAVAGVAVKDFDVEGYRIPAGSRVLALLHATGFDTNVYTNPREFQPERFLPPRSEGESNPTWEGWMVAFGAGDSLTGHSCGGKYVSVTLMLDICVRMVQAWQFKMVDPQEKMKIPGAGVLPENGLQLSRI